MTVKKIKLRRIISGFSISAMNSWENVEPLSYEDNTKLMECERLVPKHLLWWWVTTTVDQKFMLDQTHQAVNGFSGKKTRSWGESNYNWPVVLEHWKPFWWFERREWDRRWFMKWEVRRVSVIFVRIHMRAKRQ